VVARGKKSEGGFVPGGLAIDRDFGQDFIVLEQRGGRKARGWWGGFEACRSSV